MHDLIERPPIARPAPEELRTAFPFSTDRRFDDHLVALDHGYNQEASHRGDYRARPFRVLVLAMLAVLFVLMFATAAAAAAWQLADERYVDEVVRENF